MSRRSSTDQTVQDLPNLNRNLSEYEVLTPGVQRSSYNTAATENPQGIASTSANGANFGSQGFILDGTNNREPVLGIAVINPTLDSVGEMQVLTSNYDAEFGGAVGGIIVVQTKSGSNSFHGDAFEFRHSDAQEARDPFANFAPNTVTGRYLPSSLYNQFGGSLGGPIKKESLFFFMDYQGTRQRLGNSFLENVPTALVRSTCLSAATVCNLSEYGRIIHNPLTGVTYAGNGTAIPAADIASQARYLLNQFPAPNVPGAGITNNYAASGNGVSNADQADLRIDLHSSQKLHAFGRYDIALFRLSGAPSLGAAGGAGFGAGNSQGNDAIQNQNAALGMDYAFSPTLLTDAHLGLLKYHVELNKLDNGTAPATAAGLPNLNTGTQSTSGSPTFNVGDGTIANFGNQNCNCPLHQSEVVFQLTNNWTKTISTHNLKFGADLRFAEQLRVASDDNRAGVLTFNQDTTQLVGSSSPSGLGIATLLLGDVSAFNRYIHFDLSNWVHQKRGAFYAQDSWRATNRLTINYGVRWVLVFPETVAPNQGGFTDLSQGAVRVAGEGGIPTNGGQLMNYRNVEPRLGIAYQVHPKTVVRAAAAQVYDDEGFYGVLFGAALTQNIPSITVEDYSDAGVGPPRFTFNTLPVPSTRTSTPADGLIPMQNDISYSTIRPLRMKLAKVDQFNAAVEQQFGHDIALTIAYVGNHGEHVYVGETGFPNPNAVRLPTTPADLNNRNARRRLFNAYNHNGVLCCDQDLYSGDPSSSSNYNSLQTSFSKRYSRGAQMVANYVWSKATNYSDPYYYIDPRVNHSRNGTNRTNVFTLYGSYELPFGRNRMFARNINRGLDAVIGGWQVAGDGTWESGVPFTPTYGECASDQDVDTDTSGGTDCRPNGSTSAFPRNVGALNPATHGVHYFTPVTPLMVNGAAAGPFQRPQFGQFGNVGRNSMVGPSELIADASLLKNIRFTEQFRGQFQFQAFNVFNHPALAPPNAYQARCIDCGGQAGQITSLDQNVPMRQLQFGFKLAF